MPGMAHGFDSFLEMPRDLPVREEEPHERMRSFEAFSREHYGGLLHFLRLRVANDTPLAIERASLSAGILPDPSAIGSSLYAALEASGNRPVRAVQRISAANLGTADAGVLQVAPGSAGLRIERISYLASGKVIEFTRSIYRGDAYDFVAELRLALPGDDITPDSFTTFWFDGGKGLYIHPNIWHEALCPVNERMRFFGRQGKVHARVGANFPKEFGCYLSSPLRSDRLRERL